MQLKSFASHRSTCLTLKSMMVRTIVGHCKHQPSAANNLPLPLTFVVYPAENKVLQLPCCYMCHNFLAATEHQRFSFADHHAPSQDGTEETAKDATCARPHRPARSNACQRADLLTAHAEACTSSEEKKPLWIAKGSAGCKGDGIVVSTDVEGQQFCIAGTCQSIGPYVAT